MVAIFPIGSLEGQEPPTVPEESRVKVLPRQKLAGPRFGFTVFTGETADQRDLLGLEPIMSQFGWQFETQIVSLTGGNQALMEWIVLLGGLEQNENNVSVAWMAGYRLANGLEFGVGPNLSHNFSQEVNNTSMVMAAGATMPFGDLYVPVNVACAFSDGGPRVTTLVGWIVG
jgi:hypothetical protein